MPLNKNAALIVVDVQNDFLETGALPVACASEIIGPINSLSSCFPLLAFSQDWHPADHISFASNHPGKQIYDSVQTSYGAQALWPDHCVAQTAGADFAPGLDVPQRAFRVFKGANPRVDSYSAFLEADRKSMTPLAGWLRSQSVERVYVCGLAEDFCVSWTALDAAELGFEVFLIEDACRAIDVNGSLENERERWRKAGIRITTTRQVLQDIS
jgi:nicotinamidase/pyrazinamidase